MKSLLRYTREVDVELTPAYKMLRELPLKERDDIATASILADTEEQLLKKYRLLTNVCLCRLFRKRCRCSREGGSWMGQAPTSFGGLWDHPRLFENRETGECILILHPYSADLDGMTAFTEFCRVYKLDFYIRARNAYYPSRAFAIVIQRAGGNENIGI